MINKIIKQIERTDLNKIEQYLHYVFGSNTGRTLFFTFSLKLEELYKVSEFEDRQIANIAFKYILPVIAMHRSFVENGMDSTIAIKNIRSYFIEYDKKEIEKFASMINTPFYYSFFDRRIKKFQETKMPTEKFSIEWLEFNLQRVYFNVNKCMYLEILKEYGEEKLLQIFCDREKIKFSKINSKIEFTVPKIILNGDECCQFRYFKKNS